MIGNKCKKYMSSIEFDSLLLSIFYIQTRKVTVVSFMDIIWEIPFANWLKSYIDGVIRGCRNLTSYANIFLEIIKINMSIIFSTF